LTPFAAKEPDMGAVDPVGAAVVHAPAKAFVNPVNLYLRCKCGRPALELGGELTPTDLQ